MSSYRIPSDHRARVAIDLGAESCRVSLLRWRNGVPAIDLIHRIPNGPVSHGSSLHWPLDAILAGIDEGLRKAANAAPEGIASIAVDGWAVDYVRLDAQGNPLHQPFCYRDERTITAKESADKIGPPEEMYHLTGAQPLRINTVYQLIADRIAGEDMRAPWICLPEYVLHWLGAPRVAEYTNATHTGLVDLATGTWSQKLFASLDIPVETAPPIVPAGTVLGRVQGPLATLDAFRSTDLIAPACHDTASAIAGISVDLDATVYICSGTWSLVGTLVQSPITTLPALSDRFTNQGAACGGFCFHTNVNGMWLLKQCMEIWAAQGRALDLDDLIRASAASSETGLIDVDAEPLLLSGNMPERINRELTANGFQPIPDAPGSEPLFARVIFESLAARYARAIASLEQLLDRKLNRIHIIGGASRNRLLASITSQCSGLPVECGEAESSTIGNFAVQLAACESPGRPLRPEAVRRYSAMLSFKRE
jgi:rhamnulokinase